MLPAISKLLPHLPGVFRHKGHSKSVSGEQASEIANGSTLKHFSFQIVLLDNSELTLYAKPNSKAKALLDQVFNRIGIIEKEYFGLCIKDESKGTQWIDLQKTIASQLTGKRSFTLFFAVKFYAADPCKLFQEVTRYQFFLQVKQDILEGRLPAANKIAAELAAYAIQSELGDYNRGQHAPGYSSEFSFIPNQTEHFERRVEELHRRLVGLVPARAESCYLDKVKWLDMYGVDLHPVQGEGAVDYFLGIAPTGILIYRNKVKISNHFWPRMVKVSCKGTQLVLRVRDKDNAEKIYTFFCMTKQACKLLEQSCVEHHQFFRTNAASYSYQTTIKLFAADAKFRLSSLDRDDEQQTPSFTRRSSLRRKQRSSSVAVCHHQSFTSLSSKTAPNGHLYQSIYSGRESPTSVRSAACTRRSYASSDVGCTSRKRQRRNCCTDISDAESHVSLSSRRPHWSENTIMNESDCESLYSCCPNKSIRSTRRSHRINYDCCDTQSVAGSRMRRQLNGSMTSMLSAPEPRSHRRGKHSRRRRLPPEELAQHFRYVDPSDMGVTSERLQAIPYTNVETDTAADSYPQISPRTCQRRRQRQLKIHAAQQPVITRPAWLPEPEVRLNSSFSSRGGTVPSQYLQLPVSVQMTEMLTAPIVKIKRTDSKSKSTPPNDKRLMKRLSMSSSSSTGSDLFDVNQVATKFTHSRIEHC